MGWDYLPYINLARKIHRDVRRKWHINLPGPQIHLLESLDVNGPQRMSDLAHMLGISVSALTALADRMMSSQLLERMRSEQDRRVVLLYITDSGSKFLEDFSKTRNEALEKYFSKLSVKERETMMYLCKKMTEEQSKSGGDELS